MAPSGSVLPGTYWQCLLTTVSKPHFSLKCLLWAKSMFLWQTVIQKLGFDGKVVEEIKTHILRSITLSRKFCRLWDNMEKYGGGRHATGDSITRRNRHTRSEYVMYIVFDGSNGYANAHQCYDIRIPCLSCFIKVLKLLVKVAIVL